MWFASQLSLILHILAIPIINSYYYYFIITFILLAYLSIYFPAFLSPSFNSNWTVTVYSFVVVLDVSVDCIAFDHTVFIILYSAIQLFLLQACQ